MSDIPEGKTPEKMEERVRIRTWEIAYDEEESTHAGSIAGEETTTAKGSVNTTDGSVIVNDRSAAGSFSTAPLISPPPALSSRPSPVVPQQQEPDQGSFLVCWLSVLVALWLSLFSWIGRGVGIRTNRPLPVIRTESFYPQYSVSASISAAGDSRLDTSHASLPIVMDEACVDAKLNLEKYCLLIKRQLANKEIVLGARDKKKLEKKCDYLLQWMERNPNAKREDYLRGLDDVMRYSDKLLRRPPGMCALM